MVFGQVFAQTPSRFGSIFQNLGQKLGTIYSKAQEDPNTMALLQKYNVPELVERGKNIISGISDIASSIGKTVGDVKGAFGLAKRSFQAPLLARP